MQESKITSSDTSVDNDGVENLSYVAQGRCIVLDIVDYIQQQCLHTYSTVHLAMGL